MNLGSARTDPGKWVCENALQLSQRSRIKPDSSPAGLLTCASLSFDSPSQEYPSGLEKIVGVLDAHSYGVATDSHRLPNTGLQKTIPPASRGSNYTGS
jgi:hypothetical protein